MSDFPKVWHYESDGNGSPTQRSDQYVVSQDGSGRIATFEWPDAPRNAKLASAAPELYAAAVEALKVIAPDTPARKRVSEMLAAAMVKARR